MALLLCDGISKGCKGLCEGLCHIINLPCRICCEGCKLSSDCCCRAVTSPFFPYLAVTCAFNLPPSVWGIQSLSLGCGDDATWLVVNAVMTAIHIAAAFYIVARIQADDDFSVGGGGGRPSSTSGLPVATVYNMEGGKQTESTSSYQKVKESFTTPTAVTAVSRNDGSANSWSRMCHIISYDAGVALYLIVFIVWVCWQSSGVSKVITGAIADGGGDGCGQIQKWMVNSVILGWIYMMLVCTSFCCSLICLRPV